MQPVNALEVLREAMDIEREGIRYYTKAEKSSKRDEVKQVFKRLAEDELNHLEKLELVYDHLAQNKQWLVLKDLMESAREEPPEVFADDFDVEVVDELSAIDLGVKAEEDSISFYVRASKACELGDKGGCEIFKWLVDLEREHLKLLKDMRSRLAASK